MITVELNHPFVRLTACRVKHLVITDNKDLVTTNMGLFAILSRDLEQILL